VRWLVNSVNRRFAAGLVEHLHLQEITGEDALAWIA
jgi:hypothetical protein